MPPPSDDSSDETYHRGRKLRKSAAGLAVAAGVAYSFLRWRPYRVEVSGTSMVPTLLPGDWALAVKPGRLRRGDVVVIEHPRRPGLEMVKRIISVPDDLAPNGRILEAGEWWVEGDNPDASTDSRHFGPVTRDRIKARLRLVYWPAARRCLL